MRRLKTSEVVLVGAIVLAVLIAPGCASKKETVFLNEEVNFGAVQRVAVIPFENFTNDVHAPEKVEQILMIELLRAQAFELADPGDVRRALAESRIEPSTNFSREQASQIGEKLQAQALLMGTVQDFGLDRSSGVSSPSVSLHFKMVDCATGDTIWSSVISRHGPGASARLFGVGGKSLNEALRDMIREALETLIE